MRKRHSVGIDEAGRGPLAGPVAVGVVRVSYGNERRLLKGIKNSKALSEAKRHAWFEKMEEMKKDGVLDFAVSMTGPSVIDREGIVVATQKALNRSLLRLGVHPKDTRVYLDGALRGPKKYAYQETIIKGDEKKPIIAAASIVAKVTRDRKMERLAEKYPGYGFEQHKGYGTKEHRAVIKKRGKSKIHRRTFCSS